MIFLETFPCFLCRISGGDSLVRLFGRVYTPAFCLNGRSEANSCRYQGVPPEPGEEGHPNVTFSIQWRGNDNTDMEAMMNNLLASLADEQSTRGYTDNEISTYLPMTKVTQQQVDNGAQCTTCFDTFKLDDEVGCLDCKHIFHRPCIEPWLKTKNSCPVCRQKVSMAKWRKDYNKKVRKIQKRKRATNRDLQAEEAVLEDLD